MMLIVDVFEKISERKYTLTTYNRLRTSEAHISQEQ